MDINKQNEHELFRLDVVTYVASSIFNRYISDSIISGAVPCSGDQYYASTLTSDFC